MYTCSSFGNDCRLAGRVGGSLYHISSISGLCILLLRVRVLVSPKYHNVATIFHCCIIGLRTAVATVDMVLTKITTDPDTGMCLYQDIQQVKDNKCKS
jgi:hypothetical protein